MTEHLDEIRERFAAITPGPWRWYGNTATDQVYLATAHSGRETIIAPSTRVEQVVYHHIYCEGYTLEQARANVISWCDYHAGEAQECRCDELRDFLSGDLDPEEGHRDLDRSAREVWLTRAALVRPDLRLGVDGLLRSYRDMARYEVLGRKLGRTWAEYRTVAEFEAEQGQVGGERPISPPRPVKDALYREDFVGLDHPDATFIERAPEDIAYLLKRLGAAEQLIHALSSPTALLTAAQARFNWEDSL